MKVEPLPPESSDEARLLREDKKILIRLAPPRSTRLSDVLIVFFYHMLPFTSVPVILIILNVWYLYRKYEWYGVGGFVATFVLLATLPLYYNRDFRKRLAFLYTAMVRYMKDVKVMVPAYRFENQRPHIFAFHPHGRMFYSSSLLIQLNDIWRAPFLPTADFFGAAADGFFAVPILRHLLYAIGAMPASKKNIVKRLRQKHNVAIIVGGVKEVCLGTNPDHDELYLQKRKGFIKIAIEENLGVVPVYCFNENQLFRHDSKEKLKFWEKVNKYVNVGVPGMRGVLGLTMPFQRDLLVVVGDPMYPKEGESVDEFHARYIEALEALFKRYVGLSPHPEHKLIIS